MSVDEALPPGMLLADGEEQEQEGELGPDELGGGGIGAGTGEGGDISLEHSGGGFGGGTGGGVDADHLFGAETESAKAGEEDSVEILPGAGLRRPTLGDEDKSSLLSELKAGMRELLQEQHCDVVERLKAIQVRLDDLPKVKPLRQTQRQKPLLATTGPTKKDDDQPLAAEPEPSAGSSSETLRVKPRRPTPGSEEWLKAHPAARAAQAMFSLSEECETITPPPVPDPEAEAVVEYSSEDAEIAAKRKRRVQVSPETSDVKEFAPTPAYVKEDTQTSLGGISHTSNQSDLSVLELIALQARKKKGIKRTLPRLVLYGEQDSLATGAAVRETIRSDRKSLIMPPGATAHVGRASESTNGQGARASERSNFSSVAQSFSVMPSEGDDGDEDEHAVTRNSEGRRQKTKKGARRAKRSGWRSAMFLPTNFGEEEKPGFWVRVSTHNYFDFASGALILASTVCAGAETNFMAQHNGETDRTYFILRMFFLACFAVELLLRILGAGLKPFFTGKDRSWNNFDAIMVAASGFEVVVQIGTGENAGGGSGRILRILRIVRISRALRLGRVLRYARTFRQIVYSLQSSIGTLFWAMVMIFLVVYCFAVCFCQAFSEYLQSGPESPLTETLEEDLLSNYSTLGRSLYALFLAMTGGRSWGELVQPLMCISSMYTVLFVLFVSLTFFGVLNVVAAIFVDSAMQSQQHYKDLLIQENVMKKEVYSQHLREVFHEIDRDSSGHINGDEMEFFLADPSLNLYLESIDIFPNDARSLFRLLDRDGSGEVSIEEFCQGCLRLKGEAKSFDIHCLIYANDRSQRKLDQIISWMTSAVTID